MNGIEKFEEFLSDLLNSFIRDPRIVAFIKGKLSAKLLDLRTQAIREVDQYVTKQLIPKLSGLIESFAGVSVKPQLMLLKPFITRGLATFLEGRILDKNEIIQMAKKTLPELVIITVIPNASEDTKTLVRNALNQVQEAVFAPTGTTPSLEKLLKTLYEKCAEKIFCIDKDKLCQVTDKLIELMPENIDGIMEFLIKHVLPAMSGCFQVLAFPLVWIFLQESFERLRKKGRIRGRDLAKPLVMKAFDVATSTQVAKKTAGEVSKVSKTVVEQTVKKSKLTHKLVQKCVIDKAGGKVVVETTKKAAVKSSKTVVAKVTQNAGSKTVTTATQVTAKQSVKVGSKAVKSVSAKSIKSIGETTQQGVRVAGRKTVQKASVKVTKNIGKGISNGVTDVTKKATVKQTTKTAVTETAETITTTTTTKVTKESVNKTTHISQTSSKAAAEVGMKNAAKAGLTAAGISALVGGVFLYRDLKDLDKKKENGSVSATEYKEQKAQRIGEFAGDVIGSGVVGVAVSVAALTGPAGLAAIGAGALLSFATGKLGGRIAKALA